MKTYLIRSIKYLIWLALLFTLIFVLMIRTNTARAGGEQMLHELFHTQRGWMMIGMLMVLAFLYPRFGFTSRSLKGSVAGYARRRFAFVSFARSGTTCTTALRARPKKPFCYGRTQSSSLSKEINS